MYYSIWKLLYNHKCISSSFSSTISILSTRKLKWNHWNVIIKNLFIKSPDSVLLLGFTDTLGLSWFMLKLNLQDTIPICVESHFNTFFSILAGKIPQGLWMRPQPDPRGLQWYTGWSHSPPRPAWWSQSETRQSWTCHPWLRKSPGLLEQTEPVGYHLLFNIWR